MNIHDPFNNVRSNFIEKIGLVVQGDGMSRIAGCTMVFIVFDGGANSFSELAEELQVSHGNLHIWLESCQFQPIPINYPL